MKIPFHLLLRSQLIATYHAGSNFNYLVDTLNSHILIQCQRQAFTANCLLALYHTVNSISTTN